MMPTPRRRLSADVRREQILEVATRLFIERGFEGVKMADIAEKLHTSRPNIYTYYASTQDILEVLLKRLSEEWDTALTELLTEDPLVSSRKVFAALLEHADLILLLYSGGGPEFNERREGIFRLLDNASNTYLRPATGDQTLRMASLQRTILLSAAYEQLRSPGGEAEQLGHLIEQMLLAGFETEMPGIQEKMKQAIMSGEGPGSA